MSISLHPIQGLGLKPHWKSPAGESIFLAGDCLELLGRMTEGQPDGIFDMIFADPPYFLSNGGVTCKGGKMVSVNKGAWDKSQGPEMNHAFNREWLGLCRRALKPDGTIWISGTHHVIFSVGYALQELGYKILNDITWVKPNPPPNLSCRYFTHSTETVIWAAKGAKSKHVFNYPEMKKENQGKQMKTVWPFYPPSHAEKALGKHPTQKPLALLERCIRACTHPGAQVLDPFMGSGSTAVACLKTGRRFVGIEKETQWMKLAIKRMNAVSREKACPAEA